MAVAARRNHASRSTEAASVGFWSTQPELSTSAACESGVANCTAAPQRASGVMSSAGITGSSHELLLSSDESQMS